MSAMGYMRWTDIVILPFAYLAFAMMVPGFLLLLAVTWVDEKIGDEA